LLRLAADLLQATLAPRQAVDSHMLDDVSRIRRRVTERR
jgi:hypothetical protein